MKKFTTNKVFKASKLFMFATVALVGALFATSCSSDDDYKGSSDRSDNMTTYTVETSLTTSSSDAGTRLANKLQAYFLKGFGTNNVTLSVTYNASSRNINFVLKAKDSGIVSVDNCLKKLQENGTEVDNYIDGVDGVVAFTMNFKKGGDELFDFEYTTHYYNAYGMWRGEANGQVFTINVIKPLIDLGGGCNAQFFYNGKQYDGTAKIQNTLMTFTTDSGCDIKMTATFGGNDTSKFTATVAIGGATVASGVVFSHPDELNNIQFSQTFVVVDPENELPAMGASLADFNEAVKAVNTSCDTGNTRFDTAFGSLAALQTVVSVKLSKVMKEQCQQFPALLNSKVYIKSTVIQKTGDIETSNNSTNIYYSKLK